MNLPAPQTPGSPLKLPPRDEVTSTEPEPVHQTAAQREMEDDLEALRERESNLREYEARLRAWQAQLDERAAKPATASEPPFVHGVSQLPFSSDSLLASSWEKFHRARAILESEQKQMRDERMMMRDAELTLKRKETELAAREQELAYREKKLLGATPTPLVEEPKKGLSAMERLTAAPFRAARSAFKSDK